MTTAYITWLFFIKAVGNSYKTYNICTTTIYAIVVFFLWLFSFYFFLK